MGDYQLTFAPAGAVRPKEAELDFDELFHRFAPYVATIGVRLLGRDSDVEDLVQDVFADAYAVREKLQDIDSAKGWLATVAVRKAGRRLRRRRLRARLGIESGHDYADLRAPGLSSDELAELRRLFRALDKLNPSDRVAWSLRHLQGEKLADIAVACGCSLATAKRRIERAQQSLVLGGHRE